MTQRNTPFRSRMNTMDIKTTRKWHDGYPFVLVDSSDEDEGNCGCFGKNQKKLKNKKQKNRSGKKSVKLEPAVPVPPVFILPRIVTTTKTNSSCHSFPPPAAIYPTPRSFSIHSGHSIKSERLQPTIVHSVNWHPDIESSLGYGSKLELADCGDSWGGDSFDSESETGSRISRNSDSGDGSSSTGYDILRPRIITG